MTITLFCGSVAELTETLNTVPAYARRADSNIHIFRAAELMAAAQSINAQ